ncbi:MAG: NADH-quinone oxidoreductase subunit J [Deltaproteobacteria bacterium]|nr:NADH-quinone oxidoreductase subunit J [Deltaproteobacteria bacterium]
MNELFYISSAVAAASTIMVITRANSVHALLYLIVSLLSVAVIFYILGAPFIAALEVIIYAGAIMVLFVFVIMMLNPGPQSEKQERLLLTPRMWAGPAVLSLILISELIYALTSAGPQAATLRVVSPKDIGVSLFGPYAIGVELASILLLAGLIGVYHIAQKGRQD